MNRAGKIAVVLGLMAAIGVVLAVKQREQTAPEDSGGNVSSGVAIGLPRLVDLGADKCIPCKLMAPILEEMKTEYAGRLQVDFIDVWKHPDESPKYGVTTIPTQIFYAADGRELFRHVGYFSKDDILAKWKELGVDLSGESTELPASEQVVPK